MMRFMDMPAAPSLLRELASFLRYLVVGKREATRPR